MIWTVGRSRKMPAPSTLERWIKVTIWGKRVNQQLVRASKVLINWCCCCCWFAPHDYQWTRATITAVTGHLHSLHTLHVLWRFWSWSKWSDSHRQLPATSLLDAVRPSSPEPSEAVANWIWHSVVVCLSLMPSFTQRFSEDPFED